MGNWDEFVRRFRKQYYKTLIRDKRFRVYLHEIKQTGRLKYMGGTRYHVECVLSRRAKSIVCAEESLGARTKLISYKTFRRTLDDNLRMRERDTESQRPVKNNLSSKKSFFNTRT